MTRVHSIPSLPRVVSCAIWLTFLCSSLALAQAPWRSTLYPLHWTPPTGLQFESDKLIQDFSYAGYRRGEVPIPVVGGQVYDVTTFGADASGAADATGAIQNAINAAAAAGGGVVYLPPGTFKVSPQGNNPYALRIASDRIVLRGAGRDRTFIFNDSYQMRSKHIIRVEGAGASWANVPAGAAQTLITTDLLSPTMTIPVASVAGFSVGDWVVLRATATDAFIAEHNMSDLWAGQGNSLGGVMFVRQITAIDAATPTLTIDVPIRYYLKTRDNARVHHAVAHVEEVGLENFSIANREHAASASSTGWGEEDYSTPGNGSYDAHASFAIGLRRVRNGWVSNVATYRPSENTLNAHLLSNGVLLENCRGVTVRNCDFQRPLFGGGGGNGYMYRIQASNECLIQDSAARFNRHGFVFSHMACSGNVIHGGIGQVTRTQIAGAGTTSGEGSDHHMHLSQSNLIDGVQLDQDFFTAHYRGTSGTPPQHGQTAVHSVYWNLVGLAYQPGKTFIVRSEQARYGYMIGTRGPAPGMTTAAATARTAPVDHAEGAGLGATLQPLSLYHDQLTRRLGRTPAPPVPTAVVARGAIATVALTWNESATATHYRVQRATALNGPYPLVATVTSTSHVDYGLTNGTSYFYVVTAVNGSDESSASFPATATPANAFQQDSGSDGLVSIEAESFAANVAQGAHRWTANQTAGYSGSGAMEATPNSGTTRDTGYTLTSPRLDYRVMFTKTGVHYVWLRGTGPSGSDDSVHVGLNETALSTSDRISGFGTSWTWRTTTSDGPVATITVPSVGVHTVNVWMREDGVAIDKLLLTTSASYTPSGNGPPENGPTVLPPPPAAPASLNASPRSSSEITLAWTPVGDTASYQVKRATTSGGPYTTVATGLTAPTFTDTGRAGGTAYFYVVTAVNVGGESAASTVANATTPAPPPPPPTTARLVNLATRAQVGGLAGTPIAGFVINGTGAKRMLVRAIGPGLAPFGLTSTLPDPRIAVVANQVTIVSNQDWSPSDSDLFSAVGAFALPNSSRDAAVATPLNPGAFTTPVGDGGGSGLVLLELYDAETVNTNASLVNASTRAYVGTNDAVLIPGFAIAGTGRVRLLIRAIGPSLAPFGVDSPLADPELALFEQSTVIAANNDWGAANAAEIAAAANQVGAFAVANTSRDAALLVSLGAGAYTARVSGVGGTTGTALVEIYVVP